MTMTTTDCPLCDGPAVIDDDLSIMTCDDCIAIVVIAPDPVRSVAGLAA